MSFGKYQFHSWARRGISSRIAEKDTLGKTAGTNIERASIDVSVTINNNITENKQFALFGPGDITGINSNMIIRTSPLDGIADYEPNLLPYIEFYDEDFAFRYTPASATGNNKHLRPWLSLLVLKETEFVDTNRNVPLRSIKIINKTVLPPHDQLHLWCHMHSNLPNEESKLEKFLDQLEEDVKTDPDGVYSRLLCPRKLDSKTQYHAFLVPTFETGRLAGLGQSTLNIKSQAASFTSDDNEFPVYHRWSFRTGENFDFEHLVKQLKPKVMDKKVGVRPMDCSRPGYVRADSNNEVRPPVPQILQLEGALIAPDAQRSKLSNSAQVYYDDMEKLVNLNRSQLENNSEDPFVSVPYYGMYHAMKKNLSVPGKKEIPVFNPASSIWYNEVNKNPVYRVPAGFGKQVVQENQERFMDSAWKQLKKVQDANRAAAISRFNKEAVQTVYNSTINKKTNADYLLLTQSVSGKALNGKTTVKAELNNSLVDNAFFDPAFRRLTRNNTTLINAINKRENSRDFTQDSMLKKVNRPNGLSTEIVEKFSAIPRLGNLSVFIPPSTIAGINVWSKQSNLQQEFIFNLPGFSGGLPDVRKWNTSFPVSLLIDTPPVLTTPIINIPVTGRPVIGLPARGVAVRPPLISRIQPRTLTRARPARRGRTGFSTRLITPAVARRGIDLRPTDTAGAIRDVVLVNTVIADQKLTTRQQNVAMKIAYRETSERYQFKSKSISQPVLKTASARKSIDIIFNPVKSYLKMFNARFKFPAGTLLKHKDDFLSAMAYPDIPEPAYRHLLNIDKEFLLPNLKLIENNTLSLLKTNQKFIESYLIGLNYEMGKELLWREYPTDMRGSYFRQFWDVSGFVTPDTTPEDADSMKDIAPIHRWKHGNKLGENNARDKEGDTEQLVFVIRGDLLKKFPNTVIYAQKALKEDDKNIIRTELNSDQEKKEIRFPQFQAEINPDIKLLGFDLTINEAMGTVKTQGFSDNHGWFFIIAEVPGEPQFGMDINSFINRPGDADWNDLSWENLPEDLKFVRSDITPDLNIDSTKYQGVWGKSSSDMAAILLQRPVMVAIHANEMLNKPVRFDRIVNNTITLKDHIKNINPLLLGI